MAHSMNFADISIFSSKISNFLINQKTQKRITSSTIIFNFFSLVGAFKVFLIYTVAILMMSGKLATLRPFKRNIVSNKLDDTFVHEVTKKIYQAT